MSKLKDIDFKIVFELMKNSKTSDRKLAKKIGVSQPTVTRRRAKIERELIDGYTAVPKWDKLGYKLLAIMLIKSKPVFSTEEKYQEIRKRGTKWLMEQPNVIMGGACEGMGMNSFMISIHRNYGYYTEFIRKFRLELGDILDDVQTYLVNLSASGNLKPLHLKYLAEAELPT